MPQILTVDDEPLMLGARERGLSSLGHEVVTARNGRAGLEVAAAARPDLVLLDLYLPDLHGVEFIRRLRAWTSVPVLAMSGQGAVELRIAALDGGADDFLVKPFSLDELHARLDAVLRRATPPSNGATITLGDTIIELASRKVTKAKRLLSLTPIEWKLLELLVAHGSDVVRYSDIIESVWGNNHGDEIRGSLRVHVRQLRAKLGDDAIEPRFIRTEQHIGYGWVGPAPR